MKTNWMKTLPVTLLPFAMLLGCDSGTTPTTTDMAVTPMPDIAMAPADMAMPPAAPKLGAQIERMGRPTINVAATNPFDLDLSAANAAAKTRDGARDAYNQDGDPTKWAANWAGVLGINLAVYDGADTVCGNQLLADANKMDRTRYAPLAGVLADDKLYLDTGKMSCGLYLAVEGNAVGLTNSECGGRTPLHQVVHETYTALTVGAAGVAQGAMTGKFPITDGVDKDADGTASLTDFPFLTDPN